MLLVVFCLFIQAISHVIGKRDPLPRFILEDRVKPSIFGSYSYDLVKQVFDLPPSEENVVANITVSTDSHVSPTMLSPTHSEVTEEDVHTTEPPELRKHAPTLWWLRPKRVSTRSPSSMRSFSFL